MRGAAEPCMAFHQVGNGTWLIKLYLIQIAKVESCHLQLANSQIDN